MMQVRIAEDRIAEEELLADIAIEEDDDGDGITPFVCLRWSYMNRSFLAPCA